MNVNRNVNVNVNNNSYFNQFNHNQNLRRGPNNPRAPDASCERLEGADELCGSTQSSGTGRTNSALPRHPPIRVRETWRTIAPRRPVPQAPAAPRRAQSLANRQLQARQWGSNAQ